MTVNHQVEISKFSLPSISSLICRYRIGVITPDFQSGDVGSIPTICSMYFKLPDGVAVAQMFLVHLGLVRIQLG